MKKVHIKIKKNVSLFIFEEPCIKERITQLFYSHKESIYGKITEIVTYLNVANCKEFSSDTIFNLFEQFFYRDILTASLNMALTEEGKYDLQENILFLLSSENLTESLTGKTMCDTFLELIRTIPNDSTIYSKRLSIKRDFLKFF